MLSLDDLAAVSDPRAPRRSHPELPFFVVTGQQWLVLLE